VDVLMVAAANVIVFPEELVESVPGPVSVVHAPPVETARKTEPVGAFGNETTVAGKPVIVVGVVAVRPM
jgi:hypothetical protein